jgi:hypothetical protein
MELRFIDENGRALISVDQISNLKQRADAQAVQAMAGISIRPAQALGISIPTLRKD